MTMRTCGGYAYCDVCRRTFCSTPTDKPGQITHPRPDEYPDMHPVSFDLYSKCPDAGKTFAHPAMEEVEVSAYRKWKTINGHVVMAISDDGLFVKNGGVGDRSCRTPVEIGGA